MCKDSATRASNLKRHSEWCHPNVFEKIKENDQVKKMTKFDNASTFKRETDLKLLIFDKITITMTAKMFHRT